MTGVGGLMVSGGEMTALHEQQALYRNCSLVDTLTSTKPNKGGVLCGFCGHFLEPELVDDFDEDFDLVLLLVLVLVDLVFLREVFFVDALVAKSSNAISRVTSSGDLPSGIPTLVFRCLI